MQEPESESASPRILVVDDEPQLLKLMVRALSRDYSGIQSSGHGLEARDLLEQNHYDLLLSDIDLPGCSGIDLMFFCKSRHPDTEVILITGKPDHNHAADKVMANVSAYLHKPVTMQELRDQVRKALEKRNG